MLVWRKQEGTKNNWYDRSDMHFLLSLLQASTDSVQNFVASAWQGLSEGLAAAASSLPEGNDYEAALGSLAAKAGGYMNGVYNWASQGWGEQLALQEKGCVRTTGRVW